MRLNHRKCLAQVKESIQHDVLGLLERGHAVLNHEFLKRCRGLSQPCSKRLGLQLQLSQAFLRYAEFAMPRLFHEFGDGGIHNCLGLLGVFALDGHIDEVRIANRFHGDLFLERDHGVLGVRKALVRQKVEFINDPLENWAGRQELGLGLHVFPFSGAGYNGIDGALHVSQVNLARLNEQARSRCVARGSCPGVQNSRNHDSDADK